MGEIESRCGLVCGECEYKEKVGCPGCIEAGGEMFWGSCDIARCCNLKDFDHCGQCQGFPCDMLKKFSYDENQGDDGRRIENLKQWNKKSES